jgi:hypothetical protein
LVRIPLTNPSSIARFSVFTTIQSVQLFIPDERNSAECASMNRKL